MDATDAIIFTNVRKNLPAKNILEIVSATSIILFGPA